MVIDNNSKFLAVFENNDNLVSLEEIMNSDAYAGMSKLETNRKLMELEREGEIFKKIKDGKYYYTSNKNLADTANPYQKWLSTMQNGFNNFMSMTEEEKNIFDVASAIGKVFGTGKTPESEDAPAGLFDFKYTNGKTYKTEAYTIAIPDGFSIREQYEDRDYIIWYPSEENKDDPELSNIKIYESDVVNTDDTLDSMISTLKENPEISEMMNDGFSGAFWSALILMLFNETYGNLSMIANMMGCTVETFIIPESKDMYGAYYKMKGAGCTFYYFNIVANGISKLIRIDILNMEDSTEIQDCLCDFICRIKPNSTDKIAVKLDDEKYLLKVMTVKEFQQWHEAGNEQYAQISLATQLAQTGLEARIKEQADSVASAKKIIKEELDKWVNYIIHIYERMAEETCTLVKRQYELKCSDTVLLKLMADAEDSLKGIKKFELNVNNGEIIITACSEKYKELYDSLSEVRKTVAQKEKEEAEAKKEAERKAKEEAERKAREKALEQERREKEARENEQRKWQLTVDSIKNERREEESRDSGWIRRKTAQKLDALQQSYDNRIASDDAEIASLLKEIEDYETEFSGLSVFKFMRKNELKKLIPEKKEKVKQTEQHKVEEQKRFNDETDRLKKQERDDLNALKTSLDKKYVIPDSPEEKKRKEEAEKRRIEEEKKRVQNRLNEIYGVGKYSDEQVEIRKEIIRVVNYYGPSSVADMQRNSPVLGSMSTTRITAFLTLMLKNGKNPNPDGCLLRYIYGGVAEFAYDGPEIGQVKASFTPDKKIASINNGPQNIQDEIVRLLKNSDRPLSIAEMQELSPLIIGGCSTSRITGNISPLLVNGKNPNPEGIIVRSMDRKVAKFSLK